MSPCCVAAATATAFATAVTVVGLTTFVLATDAFGAVVLATTALAAILNRMDRIAAPPWLWYALSLTLAARAAWLLSTTRRHLILAVWRFVLPRAAGVARRLIPRGRAGRSVPEVHQIGPG